MKLDLLLENLDTIISIKQGNITQEISSICYDSRKVKKDCLFVCLKGANTDGHQYIAQALANGAIALLVEDEVPNIPAEIVLLQSGDNRYALARLSAKWWGNPSRDLYLIGVTGTNGKTTTTHLIKWLLENNNCQAGLIGTIHNLCGDVILPSTHTTPESLEIAELLRGMVNHGCQVGVMEVSSHALKQQRVAGCYFKVGVFTNLTQDHLDFHKTFADYCASKCLLFAGLQDPGQYGIINIDDPYASQFLSACKVPTYTYSLEQPADLQVTDYHLTANGTVFHLIYQAKKYEIEIPLLGKFNIYNTVAAMAVALVYGMEIEDIIARMTSVPQVAGRFEMIRQGQDFTVVVDYAHSPDGLLNLLSTAREMQPQRIITVFGCGGDRDKTKRPIMGQIAGERSDFVILTSDNPRTEDPFSILQQVEVGIKVSGVKYLCEENRSLAIQQAIQMAQPHDMVVIAGKGHEDYQLVMGKRLHFDDREEACNCLKTRLSKQD